MRDKLLEAFKSHAKGHIDKHIANIEVLLNNPTGIGEHGDIVQEIEKEMAIIANYDDLLEMANKYFK